MKVQIFQELNNGFTRTLVLHPAHGDEVIIVKQKLVEDTWEYASSMSIPQAVLQKVSEKVEEKQEAVIVQEKTDYEVMDLSRETRLALYNIESTLVPISNNQQECIENLECLKEYYGISDEVEESNDQVQSVETLCTPRTPKPATTDEPDECTPPPYKCQAPKKRKIQLRQPLCPCNQSVFDLGQPRCNCRKAVLNV